ncbi:MAG: signal peptide peptidase SppA [Methanobacteriota archaeon]|nr:MAG: signal peptide peptidase SppA [Euryarchaeota archaeon]
MSWQDILDGVFMRFFRRTRNLKRRIFKKKIGYVHLVLSGKIPVYAKKKSFIEGKVFPSPPLTLLGLYETTLRLVSNPRVKGLIIHLSNLELERYGDYEFLRNLMKIWTEYGKKVYVYASNYDTLSYYLASAATKVYLTQGGILGTIGLNLEIPFLKEFLEKWGFQAQVVQISPYKSAANNLFYEEMPKEQEKMINWMLDSLYEGVVLGISQGRSREINDVTSLIDNSPLTDREALDQGWIDGILSSSDILSEIKKEDSSAVITEYADALGRLPIPGKKKAQIALIPAVGGIVDGQGSDRGFPNPFEDRYQVADISTINAIRAVRKNKKKYKAALLFVDSPGGSATASENILNELRLLSKEMPLYAYFHSVAGSGGYYISMASKKIYSERTTITASIGVLTVKLIRKGLIEQQKIKPYVFNRGAHADLQSPERPWNEEELNIVKKQIENIYDIFLDHVSTNRGIERDKLHENAQGKVFIAPQALEKNLLDKIIPLKDALEEIASEVGSKTADFHVFPPIGKPIAPLEMPDPKQINGKIMLQMFPPLKFR